MGKTTVQESLNLKKYQKDLEKIKEKRGAARALMQKKLKKQGYKFQKDQVKVEKKFNKKKKEGTLTEKDILEAFICLELTPMVHGAAVQIRSGNEAALLKNTNSLGKTDGKQLRLELPGSWQITNGVMALLEPEVERLQKKLKKFYKELYTKGDI